LGRCNTGQSIAISEKINNGNKIHQLVKRRRRRRRREEEGNHTATKLGNQRNPASPNTERKGGEWHMSRMERKMRMAGGIWTI
jgi:hypothetical protein